MTQIDTNSPHVAVLMPVRNGAAFLREQIASINVQTYANWTLFASDDGSTDESRLILDDLAGRMPNVKIFNGPQQGQTPNVVSLLNRASEEIDLGSWVALADQDDFWLPHRLLRGVDRLQNIEGPALYCARTLISDAQLKPQRTSRLHVKRPSFQNALVQNIASGNTILLNSEASKLIRDASSEVQDVIAPDCWVYQIVTGAGGQVVFDSEPALMYRQHGENQFGENRSATASQKRLRQILNGDFKEWVSSNLDALLRSEHRLTDANRACLRLFVEMRQQTLFGRLRTLARMGLYRQSKVGTLAIWCAALLGRI